MTVAILNPDGSHAEMSGNGTRIAAAWLMGRTGSATARVHVGPRTVAVRRTDDGLYESELGPVEVGPPEVVDGVELVAVVGRQPSCGRGRRPESDHRARPAAGGASPRFPERTNVQVARIERPGEVVARVWERGVGETSASGTSAVAVAAATHGDGEVVVHFPGGGLRVRLADGRAWLTGPAEPLPELPDSVREGGAER